MRIELNIAVFKDEDGDVRTDIVDSESPEEIREGYLNSHEESLACMYKVVVEDYKATGGVDYLRASAYEATQNIDRLSDIPHMHDLMMLLCSEAFEAGMKYQAEQEVKPQAVQ